jgi:hypothetical protein
MPILRFRQSPDTDVVANRIRAVLRVEDGTVFDDLDPYTQVDAPTPDADGYSRIDLGKLQGISALDGTYDLYLTAVDDAGNESEPLELQSVELDFVAPLPPTEGAIES